MQAKLKKARILFLGSQMEVAGAQRVMLSQARWFAAQGYELSAVFFYDKQGLADQWQAENPFPVFHLNAWRYGGFALANYFRAFLGMIKLWRILRHSFDVIESFTPQSNVLAMPVAWLAGVPIRIPTHHGFIENSSGMLARVHGWMVNSWLSSKMVAVSEQVRIYAMEREKIEASKIVVIENGIEALGNDAFDEQKRDRLREDLGIEKDGFMALTTGRLTIQKGHTVLLKAIAINKRSLANCRFVFAGEGPQRAALEAEAKELGVDQMVGFLGVRSDIPELLQSADLFVQPSLWEGLSLAMLEALLAGSPVLASKVEGVVDVIESGKSGKLVEPGNEEELGQAILELLENPDMRKKLGQAGRQHAKAHYSIERMSRQYESLIQQLNSEWRSGQ